jgi:hypothetical protein
VLANDERFYPFQNGTLQVPEIGSKKPLSCMGCELPLNAFAVMKFNRPGDFHGPNCYNTALIASGVYSPNQVRYVSPEEFEAVLKKAFTLTTNEKAGDILVFDAKSSRGHAALYLGDNLIFHKKSYATHYFYRIAPMTEAGLVEKNEWVPGPVEGTINQFVWPKLGELPKAFYRFKRVKISLTKEMNILETKLLTDLGHWAIAKNWGLIGKNIIQDYYKEISPRADELTQGILISFRDQVGLYFDELHYKNSRNYTKTTEEICLPSGGTDQLKVVYMALATSLKKTPEQSKESWEKILSQDKKRCSQRSF